MSDGNILSATLASVVSRELSDKELVFVLQEAIRILSTRDPIYDNPEMTITTATRVGESLRLELIRTKAGGSVAVGVEGRKSSEA